MQEVEKAVELGEGKDLTDRADLTDQVPAGPVDCGPGPVEPAELAPGDPGTVGVADMLQMPGPDARADQDQGTGPVVTTPAPVGVGLGPELAQSPACVDARPPAEMRVVSGDKFEAIHHIDEKGNPAGGESFGVGLDIRWQNGPLGRGAERKAPNGAFVETVIRVAADRLQCYQDSKFACSENAEALQYLELALAALERRTRAREMREVEGTHAV